MRAIVYVGGKIVKYHDGSKKQCHLYMQGVAEGMEAAGSKMIFRQDTPGEPMWGGWTAFGSPIAIFTYEGN